MTIILRHDKRDSQGLQVPAIALKGLDSLPDEGALVDYEGETIGMITSVLVSPVASLFTVDFHSTAKAQAAMKVARERFKKGLKTHVQPVFADVKHNGTTVQMAWLIGFRLTNAFEPHTISPQLLAQQPAFTTNWRF